MSDSWHENVKNKNRDEIITAGKDLFLKHNFLNVNITEVCNLAQISRITFYKHFKSIDELIFEVQMDILNTMTNFIISRDNTEALGIDRLKLLIYALIDFAKENSSQMKYIILFDLYYEAYDSNKELKAKYDNFINKDIYKEFLKVAIEHGIKDKSIKSNLDSIKTACCIFQTVIGMLERISYTSFPADYSIVTFDDIAVSVADMIIEYVKI